jgi:hypothetical protein
MIYLFRRAKMPCMALRINLYFSLLAVVLLAPASTLAGNSEPKPVSPELVSELMSRMEQLEARVRALEAEKEALLAKRAVDAAAPQPASSAPEHAATSSTGPMPQGDTMSMPAATEGTPHLNIRGFGDVRYAASNQRGSTNSFALGQLNLFITSRISDRLSMLTESVIEADSATNQFGIELERMLLNYDYSDYFKVGFGRYHSAIGYYNTAYHHSAWMQTAIERPFLFTFEDRGGVLPIHNVGVTATGRIPSGPLGLHYVAEIGNGRATRTDLGQNFVQNVSNEHNGKSFNVALYARPDAIRGLQVGVSGYHDHLTPLVAPNVDQQIFNAHAIFQRSNIEFLNEVVLMRHLPDNGFLATNSTGFYSQISHRWGSYRPYFRYEYLNVPDRDLIFPDVHRVNGPIFGVRYDWGEFTAFKIQYGRTMRRVQPSFDTLMLQTAFTF